MCDGHLLARLSTARPVPSGDDGTSTTSGFLIVNTASPGLILFEGLSLRCYTKDQCNTSARTAIVILDVSIHTSVLSDDQIRLDLQNNLN
eukprot:6461703-Amphidinium_carterae.1